MRPTPASKREMSRPECLKELDEHACSLLSSYIEMLLESPVNLTSVKDFKSAFVKHIEDVVIALCGRDPEGECVDIGTGGGIPGLVLAIVFPKSRWTLVETIGKKVRQLSRFVEELSLRNVQVFHGRAEDLGSEMPSYFDIVAVRAVARADVCLEYASPLLKLGGKAYLFKGQSWKSESQYAVKAGALLGMNFEDAVSYKLSDGTERVLTVFTKEEETPGRFPRRPGLAKKNPLGDT